MDSMDREPRYVISIAARMCGVRSYTLRYYEKIGIIEPSRSEGNIRLYSDEDIAKIKQMKTLMEDLGITIAGAEVILRMAQRITELQKRIEYLEIENRKLRNSGNI
ncbi:MAG: MerR family transcriptional regulator [Dehalococcoidales bacterium]|nr:MerR family transcriptional regulator [Dehalococcoidales bacterium]